MKRVTILFSDGHLEVYKTKGTANLSMTSLGYDFFLRNKHIPKIARCLNLDTFYREAINLQKVMEFFEVKISEASLDGRTIEAKGLKYFKVDHLVKNLG